MLQHGAERKKFPSPVPFLLIGEVPILRKITRWNQNFIKFEFHAAKQLENEDNLLLE